MTTVFTLSSRIEQLEREVSHFSSSNQKYTVLLGKLDETFDALKTSTVAPAHLEQSVVSLYGQLENQRVQREISEIQEKTLSLKQGRISKHAIRQLKEHIRTLKSNHCPLSPERRIIQEAEHALNKTTPLPSATEECINPSEVYALLEIAHLVYNGATLVAKRQFRQLPEAHKAFFEGLIHSPAFDERNPIPTLQALIATANHLANNGEGIPPVDQIDKYFLVDDSTHKRVPFCGYESTPFC